MTAKILKYYQYATIRYKNIVYILPKHKNKQQKDYTQNHFVTKLHFLLTI